MSVESRPPVAYTLLGQYLNAAMKSARPHAVKPADLTEGQAILNAAPEVQVAVIKAALQPDFRGRWERVSVCDTLLSQLVRRRLPYEITDVQFILGRLADHNRSYYPPQGLLRALARPLEDEATLAACRPALDRLRTTTDNWYESADKRKFLQLLDSITDSASEATLTIHADEWGDQAGPALDTLDQEVRRRWLELLRSCGRARGSRPNGK